MIEYEYVPLPPEEERLIVPSLKQIEGVVVLSVTTKDWLCPLEAIIIKEKSNKASVFIKEDGSKLVIIYRIDFIREIFVSNGDLPKVKWTYASSKILF